MASELCSELPSVVYGTRGRRVAGYEPFFSRGGYDGLLYLHPARSGISDGITADGSQVFSVLCPWQMLMYAWLGIAMRWSKFRYAKYFVPDLAQASCDQSDRQYATRWCEYFVVMLAARALGKLCLRHIGMAVITLDCSIS
jgi:hypothetical protein